MHGTVHDAAAGLRSRKSGPCSMMTVLVAADDFPFRCWRCGVLDLQPIVRATPCRTRDVRKTALMPQRTRQHFDVHCNAP